MKENPPGVDPLSAENKLIFCTGPITDTRIYGSCRHGVFTKSPLTGIYSESYSGENVVRYGVLENDYWRSLGRTGVGAVMGSKKMKAIVFHGGKRKEIAYPDRVEQFAKETIERAKDTPGVHNYRRLGARQLVG